MKIIPYTRLLYPILICAILGLSGCTKWLNVKPDNQISEEAVFQKASGIRNTLNGIYQQISNPTLFGRNYTWGLYSAMAQDYLISDVSGEYQYAANTALLNQDHPSVINLKTGIWSTSYHILANCNKLITEIEKIDPAVFPQKELEKNLIIGEVKGIRALLHFELLRLFAPSLDSEPNGMYIPYVDTYPAKYNAPSASNQVIQKIVKDLTEAQQLVAQSDTLTNRMTMANRLFSLLGGSNVPGGGLFFNYRMHRLNYVALSALLARVHLYAGDMQEAKNASKYVYDNFGPTGRLKWFVFTTEANTRGNDKYTKLVDDVIFATYDLEQQSKTDAYLATANYRYRLNKEVTNWFPNTERDYRLNLLSADALVPSDFRSDKWRFSSSIQQWRPEQNFIAPVLRMSEIYYIYAETLFDEGNVTDALRILNEIRQQRGKVTPFTSTDAGAFYDELLAEYRREFLVEGQTVFAHKRLGRSILLGTQVIPMDKRFTIKIPDGERIF